MSLPEKIIGIDPGTNQSAVVVIGSEDYSVLGHYYPDNNLQVIELLKDLSPSAKKAHTIHLSIEFVQSYGLAVGRETFFTCLWVGRFIQAWKHTHFLYARPLVRAHLLSGLKKKSDSAIKQSLKGRFGEAKKGHPLEGISNHKWDALAVAVTHCDGLRVGAQEWMEYTDGA